MSDSLIPWTVACQAPLSMGFPRQECWSGLPFPSPGDLPDPGIDPRSVTSLLHWQVGSLLPGLPRSLAQKYPSRKPQPRPRLHLQLSQSGALCSAGNAPLWSLSWSPCHWPAVSGWPSSIVGDTAKAECPPGHCGRGPCSSPIPGEVP